MHEQPLRVETVDVEYSRDGDVAVRIMRIVAVFGIAYGAFQMLFVGLALGGMAMGFGWYTTVIGSSYELARLVHLVAVGALSVLLVTSGIGCLALKPVAWTGMLVYCFTRVGISALWAGYYVITSLHARSWNGAPSAGHWVYLMIGTLSGPIESSVFPVLALVVFRMRDVRRLFGK